MKHGRRPAAKSSRLCSQKHSTEKARLKQGICCCQEAAKKAAPDPGVTTTDHHSHTRIQHPHITPHTSQAATSKGSIRDYGRTFMTRTTTLWCAARCTDANQKSIHASNPHHAHSPCACTTLSSQFVSRFSSTSRSARRSHGLHYTEPQAD